MASGETRFTSWHANTSIARFRLRAARALLVTLRSFWLAVAFPPSLKWRLVISVVAP